MLEKIETKNILFSFVIGALIGLIAQLTLNTVSGIGLLMLWFLIGGAIGLVAGTAIEFVMAVLPVTIARPVTYFLLNNLVALFFTAVAVIALYCFGIENFTGTDLAAVLAIAVVIVIMANGLHYYKYRNLNKNLVSYIEKYKKTNG
jgi:hypothetical protein